MTPNEKTLAAFEACIRQLILRFQELKQENADLHAQMEQAEREQKSLRQQLDQRHSDYETLKMARMIQITDGDLVGAKERLNRLIRDVGKCIDILSDEEKND